MFSEAVRHGRPLWQWLLAVGLCAALAGCAGTSALSADTGTTSSARQRASALAAGTGSADAVAPQPPPNSCHARGSGELVLPDPQCTPGAIDPAVTQANIEQTICRRGYTKTVRPPVSVTDPEKRASMLAYGDSGSMHDYEYDHLVSLELGGAPNDPRNLWPEPGASPNPKDAVENRLHERVCAGTMSLADAQREIATDWVAARAGGG